MNVGDNLVFASRVWELGQQLKAMDGRIQSLESSGDRDAERLADMQKSLSGWHLLLWEKFKKLKTGLTEPGVTDDWDGLKELNIDSQKFARECVACEQSTTLRNQGKREASFLHAADQLADEFSQAVNDLRSHFVLVSENEHLEPEAGVIHVSYNRLEVWHLNRVAHEFGHLWAQGDKNGASGLQQQFIDMLTTPPQDDDSSGGSSTEESRWSEHHGREFFADIVATFLCGPAYAFACLTLDFDPTEDVVSESHPTGHERAHCILTALEALAKNYESPSGERVAKIIKKLREHWNATRETAGKSVDVSDSISLEFAVLPALKSLMEQMSNARFSCLAAASRVDAALRPGAKNPETGATYRDILNGLWLRRMEVDRSSLPNLGERGMKMLIGSPR